jgi:hypothetical protein
MDGLVNFITSNKIPVGAWGKAFFGFLTSNFTAFFDGIAHVLTWILEGLVGVLLWFPPLILLVAIAALAWYLQKSWKLALGVALGLLFILNQGLWKQMVETIVLVVAAASASMMIGVPIGIWAAHKPKVPVSSACPRPHANHADLRLSYPGAHHVWSRRCPRTHRHGDLCGPRSHPPDTSWHHLGAPPAD